tara:strand:- start:3750 stop:5270 length:1521 start_codon:yes stop_codon:yes gene_type:complete
MDQKTLKIKYGWNDKMEDFFISSNPILNTEWRGSFRIKKHSNRLFWYYQLSSRVKGRDKYLCSVDVTDDPKESFQNCCMKLMERVNTGFIISSNNKKFLHPYIDLYIEQLQKELNSDGGRRITTTSRLIRNIKDFKGFCIDNDVRLNIVPQEGCKTLFLDYMKHLKNREKSNSSRGRLSRGTIKSYLQGVRYLFDFICMDKNLNGLSLFPSHPINVEYQNKLMGITLGTIRPKEDIIKFKTEFYVDCYQTCNNKVRDLWIEYCKNNGQISGLVDKNGKVNQPPVITGSQFIYFVGLIQLRGGFRISEVLYSYRNRSIYNEYHLENHSKEMGSFWEYSDDDGWLLNIRNSKGKNRTVPITDKIWSWDKPPKGVKFEFVKDDNKGHYETDLMEVVFSMFPDSYYLFPSPNHLGNPNHPRSKTHTMNIFKETLVVKEGWDRYGIRSSHNLRSFFISYMIRKDEISPLQVCEITGHSLKTMERYYLRENLQSKFSTYKKVSQRDLLIKDI